MKKNPYPFLLLLVLFSSFLSCENKKSEAQAIAEPVPEESAEDVVERGKYLVEIMSCNNCHSPKRMGEKGPEIIPELMLSGYPAERPVAPVESDLIKEGFAMFYPDLTASKGPWGVSFAANLTPDETGIGNWTEEQFKIALTQGKAKGLENGRPLLPPMPWYNYINLKDDDIHAIFTYLNSLPPVSNVVPAPVPPVGD